MASIAINWYSLQYLRVYNALKTQSAAVKDFEQGSSGVECGGGVQSQRAEEPSTSSAAASSSSVREAGSKATRKTQLKVDFDKEFSKERFPEGIDPRYTQKSKMCFLYFNRKYILLLKHFCFHSSSLDECCICLERKPDVILPCTHSYCLPCIEQVCWPSQLFGNELVLEISRWDEGSAQLSNLWSMPNSVRFWPCNGTRLIIKIPWMPHNFYVIF